MSVSFNLCQFDSIRFDSIQFKIIHVNSIRFNWTQFNSSQQMTGRQKNSCVPSRFSETSGSILDMMGHGKRGKEKEGGEKERAKS